MQKNDLVNSVTSSLNDMDLSNSSKPSENNTDEMPWITIFGGAQRYNILHSHMLNLINSEDVHSFRIGVAIYIGQYYYQKDVKCQCIC